MLEQIEKYVQTLSDLSTADEEKLKILEKLEKKQPSTEVIVKTGIGKAIKLLTKDSNEAVAKKANLVKEHWQALLERRVELSLGEKPQVKVDLETERIRNKALTLLNRTYAPLQVDIDLLKAFEKKLYSHFRPCINAKYRRAARKVVVNPSRFLDSFKDGNLDDILKAAVK